MSIRAAGFGPTRAAPRRASGQIEEVVSDYDDRTLTSALPPLSDARQAVKAVYDAVAGYGPLQRHLDDPSIEEVWISERLTHG